MKPFPKRSYPSVGLFIDDMRFLLRNRAMIKRMMQGEGIDPKFRERLMLAVTEVNNCRFCARAHTRMALEAGVEAEEIRKLLEGQMESIPEAERPAVLYAQHWAETCGQPDPEAVQSLGEKYGKETVEWMHCAMRLVRIGNYTGNTVDRILYAVSFGRLGTQPALAASRRVTG
ncbi:MAG TPA: carboxymuconolactone decarboxylase family protein [Candidatus Hydrogenedentes bacterium]|nr:carboxymuconolactone decarboxylase family protein [Candidatus Hydrogenedentota bacterium]